MTLQRLQNMDLKSTLPTGKLTSTGYIHDTLQVMTLECRCNMRTINEMGKVRFGIMHDNITNKFRKNGRDGPVTRKQS